MQAQAARVMRTEMSTECHRSEQYFLDGKVLPEFRELNIADINYDRLQKFVDKIGASLSGSSIQRYLGLIRKILDHAQNRDLLKSIPKFPKIPKRDEPRGWFTAKEYATTSYKELEYHVFLSIALSTRLVSIRIKSSSSLVIMRACIVAIRIK